MTDEISIKEPMRLTHQNVEDVFKDCLASTTEYTLKGVCIEVAFNREKIAEHEQDYVVDDDEIVPFEGNEDKLGQTSK